MFSTLPEAAGADHDFGVSVFDLLKAAGDADFLLDFGFNGLFDAVSFAEGAHGPVVDKHGVVLDAASKVVVLFLALAALCGGSFFGAVCAFLGLSCLEHFLNLGQGEASQSSSFVCLFDTETEKQR